ncbi:Fimbrial assembly family protein [Rippkaea orientalis PCC 8801]|uniref:Fimbrial assembly family protein n=1 Tax=Rippkaea orientalis (strain PCC 8801 / RF-1) TaxID=41431 RepID=B7K649_RIPO1|nr:PilN domain-containing protein [Rippkaea orientalis]ACK68102.1 Fimbrial assembly family protein [Rippkaea orientalis PCC 8801]
MYSLDVNFLKDRRQDSGKSLTVAKKSSLSIEQQLPIIIGSSVAVLLPVLVGVAIIVVNQLSGQTQTKIEELDAELARLNAQNKSIEEIKAEIKKNDEEIKALVQVFDQIKPWSAILQEIENQIPANVNVGSIQQEGLKLTISGFAVDYDDLNDFLLLLQGSEIFQADKTAIIEAKLEDLPIENQTPSEDITIDYPQGVKYTISTELTERPASELLQKLDRNGAVGLVRRIENLKQAGVFQP